MHYKRTCKELLFKLDSVGDDALDSIGVGTALEVAEEQTGEIGVHTLVTAADELVRECQASHQALLLEPKYRCEGAREKDSLDGGKGYQMFGKSQLLIGDPTTKFMDDFFKGFLVGVVKEKALIAADLWCILACIHFANKLLAQFAVFIIASSSELCHTARYGNTVSIIHGGPQLSEATSHA